MYMPGRLRTASRPSRTVMDAAPYSCGDWLLLVGLSSFSIVGKAHVSYQLWALFAHGISARFACDFLRFGRGFSLQLRVVAGVVLRPGRGCAQGASCSMNIVNAPALEPATSGRCPPRF